MGDGEGRPAGRARPGGPAFVLVTAKLRHPVLRPGTVGRPGLTARLAGESRRPVVSVVAPPGFGKTTLLAQWAQSSGRPFAWVSVEEPDNDPKVLLTYVAEALNAVTPISGRVFDALASPGSSVPGSVVPRLCAAFAAMTAPVVLALDDVHVLHNRECRAALSALADHVPAGAQLVLAGRARPPARLARLRAQGRLTEIGARDLTLSTEEAAALLREAGVTLGQDQVAELHRRTEGWPAALYLAALHLRQGGSLPRAAVTFGGANRQVSDYLKAELLSRVSRRQRVFLTRTSVLERLSGPLCEAVLETPGSPATLAELTRSNMMLVPLGGRPGWYRYHHLFRDMLLADLHRTEPGLAPVLQGRAARWCSGNGLPEEALAYAMAAGAVGAAGSLVLQLWPPAYAQGRIATLHGWVRWLEERDGVDAHPMLPVLASLMAIVTGRPADADHWADVVDRRQRGNGRHADDPAAASWAVLLRADLCRYGVEQMRADADEAVRRFAAEPAVLPSPLLCQGIARALCGDPGGADESFAEAIRLGEDAAVYEVAAAALCERALLVAAQEDWARAGVLAQRAQVALRRAGTGDSYLAPLVCAAQARTALHRGDDSGARRALVQAQRTRHLLSYAVPYLAVQARIELARVHLDLADLAGARTLLREIDAVLRRRPRLGTLTGEARALRARLSGNRADGIPGASALTAAELRLLPLLATHLSVAEIAAELALSPNTVKSQAASVYRKLMATSRAQAVARSRELALLEG
jgi:LuxR family transcriptional regulator, maltose regulon positive regulatory protein